MSAVPTEILQEIIVNLSGLDVIRCRQVCKLWKGAVDGLTDSQWKKVCQNSSEHFVYEKAQRKSGLMWRETYMAVNSWAHIGTAKMQYRPLTTRIAHQFRILSNKEVAILISSKRDGISRDTILYCDVETCTELRRDSYDRSIRYFEENEHLVVLVCSNTELLLVQKDNKNRQVVGKLYIQYHRKNGHFALFGKRLYFQNEDSTIYLSELKKTENGQSVLSTAPIEGFKRRYIFPYIIAFGRDRNGDLVILTDDCQFHYKNDVVMMLVFHTIEGCTVIGWIPTNRLLEKCIEYGLDWTVPPLYQWLTKRYPTYVRSYKESHTSFFLHNKMVLIGLNQNIIHLFHRPFTSEGKMDLYNVKPTRSIELPRVPNSVINSVNQIDVIEALDHHLVLVQIGERVLVLKFGISPPEDKVKVEDKKDQKILPKRKMTTNNQPKSKKVFKKAKKTPKATPDRYNTSHRYNTRSRQTR